MQNQKETKKNDLAVVNKKESIKIAERWKKVVEVENLK